MKKTILLSLMMAFGLMITVGTASATGPYAMYFSGAGGNSSGGESTFPYYLQVNGSGDQAMMCDTFDRQISPGQQWNAYRLALSDLNTTNVANLFYGANGENQINRNATVADYLAAGWLYVEELAAFNNNNSDPAGVYNWAAWDLMQNSDVSASRLDPTTELAVQAALSAAQATVAGQQPDQLDWTHNVYVYTPDDGSGQEFFGPAPEPGSMFLFGTGIVGLAGLLRRKLSA